MQQLQQQQLSSIPDQSALLSGLYNRRATVSNGGRFDSRATEDRKYTQYERDVGNNMSLMLKEAEKGAMQFVEACAFLSGRLLVKVSKRLNRRKILKHLKKHWNNYIINKIFEYGLDYGLDKVYDATGVKRHSDNHSDSLADHMKKRPKEIPEEVWACIAMAVDQSSSVLQKVDDIIEYYETLDAATKSKYLRNCGVFCRLLQRESWSDWFYGFFS